MVPAAKIKQNKVLEKFIQQQPYRRHCNIAPKSTDLAGYASVRFNQIQTAHEKMASI